MIARILVFAGVFHVGLSLTVTAQPQSDSQDARRFLQSAAGSQNTSEELNEAARVALRRAVKKVFVEGAVQDPLSSSTGQGAASRQVTIVADKGEVNARGRFSWPVNDTTDLQITTTAPLSSGKATFIDATGLTGNASLNASVKIVFFTMKTQASASNMMRNFSSLQGGSTEGSRLGSLEALRRNAASSGQLQIHARALSDTGSPRLASILASPSLVASSSRFWESIVKDPELLSTTWVGYVTPGYEASRSSIDYLTADTYKKDTFRKTASAFTVSGGVSRIANWQKPGTTGPDDRYRTPLFYAGAAFRGGDSVKPGDPRNICTPTATTTGVTECFNLPVGVPATATSTSFTIELRQWARDQSIGVNPKITWSSTPATDTTPERDSRVIEVPIYLMHLVKDVTNPNFTFGADLTGGVNIGYRSSKSNPSTNGPFVTVFFTKVFDTP